MLHSNIVVGDNHYLQNWSVADNTARDALSVAAADVGKVCQVTGTQKFFVLADDSPMTWTEIGGSGGSGDVVGPASATDNAIARFDSTTGKLIQNSAVTIDDFGNIGSTGSITLGGSGTISASNLSGTNTGDQNLFSTIAVSGQSNVVADSTSDTLTLAAGSNITITTDAATDTVTIAATGGITLGTPVNSTSGTSIDYTGIPSGVKRIDVLFSGISTNGSSIPMVQIGDSGGIENTGYLGTAGFLTSTVGSINYTSGFYLNSGWAAADVFHGSGTLLLVDSSTNTWVWRSTLSNSAAAGIVFSSGSKSTSATLDRVRITMVNGTDVFDAGKVNIQYAS